MFKHVLFFYLLFQAVNTAFAANAVFQMNEQCLKAQKLIYELKFDEATKILESETLLHPDNIALPWMEESILFLKIFISEDQVLYKNNGKSWAALISKVQKSDFNNAWYRHILSDMHIHRGLIRLRFGENISAGSDIQSAYKYLKENRKMFPSFLADNKNYGLLSCAFSSVPSKYQWLAKLIGFQGDMNTGLAEMEAYLKSDQNYKEHICLKLETAYIYAMVQHQLNKNTPAAWSAIEPYTRNYRHNLLENYMRATIAGYHGMNDEMIAILKEKPAYHHAYPFYYMDFMLGLAKMRRMDPDADVYFRIFTVKYKGKNYIKSAYRNLSWISQVKNEQSAAQTYYSLCLKHGALQMEEDKQAEREAAEKLAWPPDLIKARLLFDGKYYEQALKLLKGIKESSLGHIRFTLELGYRKARIQHEQRHLAEAEALYLDVMEKGRKQPYYYAAYAALQVAIIYEEQKKTALARQYFNKAKNDFPDNKEYANSIEQKAKAGLKRIGK